MQGSIDFNEVHGLLQQLGIKVQKFELNRVLEKHDRNKDQQMSKEEFEDVRKLLQICRLLINKFLNICSCISNYVLKKIQAVLGAVQLSQQLEVLIVFSREEIQQMIPMLHHPPLNNNKKHQVHIIVC